MANRFNKKSRKRQRFLDNLRKAHKRKKRRDRVPDFNFSALHLLHDPQVCHVLDFEFWIKIHCS